MKPSDTGKTVRYSFDPDNARELTPEEVARLEALKSRPVDFTDIPPQAVDDTWHMPGPLRSLENKQQVTLRIDRDVLDFFRGTGKRYQTRINEVLREYMKAHLAPPPRR
ncbi:BrnA antitoxin family protein [Luteibacter yeojuensis]|uniref:BrnA antitoxin of type II toxin-antitoxin system n=1 Tax=Luteibacter yeojuensis TaxID=345309 RepID=A0A0F3KJK9_9GAMM|nr:BrnA antitoxin family protein [Luteibacter yeojuensis]KJV30294.1 hypothetical protein VI08_15120 [Luteibacter yeojuensis]